jgi:prepilin-type N-terminal cleavage/methylation domain-containing protein
VVHPSTSRNRRAGFTILEAMVVVAIIAISAALAAPALSEAMAQRRAGEATHELVRIGARARSEAVAYGRAHLLQYADTGDGRVQLWRGRVNLCAANDWGTILTGSCGANPDCVDQLDMSFYDHGTHRVRMSIPGGPATANVCFQPDGEMRFQSGAGGWTTTPPGSGSQGIVFLFERLEDGANAGVDRRVVFPFGATPRILR